MSKQLPFTKDQVRQMSTANLAQMREAGIKFVEILGGTAKYPSCKASAALRHQKLEIEWATPLPLPDCDKEFCLCCYIARQ